MHDKFVTKTQKMQKNGKEKSLKPLGHIKIIKKIKWNIEKKCQLKILSKCIAIRKKKHYNRVIGEFIIELSFKIAILQHDVIKI